MTSSDYAKSTLGIVGKSVEQKATKAKPLQKNASLVNATLLKKQVCKKSTDIGAIKGKKLTLKPGESVTIKADVDAKSLGSCSVKRES